MVWARCLYQTFSTGKGKGQKRPVHCPLNNSFPYDGGCVLLCFINPRVRKIRIEASSCPRIFFRTLCFYYVASSPGSPLPHLLDGHRKLVGCSAISARSCPGPVRYHWASIVELEVPPDETPGLMTFNPTKPMYYKASRMLNHHTHPIAPIRDKKTNACDID